MHDNVSLTTFIMISPTLLPALLLEPDPAWVSGTLLLVRLRRVPSSREVTLGEAGMGPSWELGVLVLHFEGEGVAGEPGELAAS